MQGGEGGNCSVLMERTDRNLRGWKVGLARDVFGGTETRHPSSSPVEGAGRARVSAPPAS